MDSVARRLELLKLEGLGFSQAEIVKELSVKATCSERTIYNDFESRATWQPILQSVVKPDEVLLKVLNRYEQISAGNHLWKMFRSYHYLNGSLGAGVRCYTAVYQGKPIAFIAVACVRMKAKYYRVSRLVVLPDYQGIGVGKLILNFIAELYCSQTKVPFYILTSNPQIIRGNMKNWKITRFGHASRRRGNTRINNKIRSSLSWKRITVSLQYQPQRPMVG